MKVLHLQTYDKNATACRRIHLGLLEKGVDSKLMFLQKTINTPKTYQFRTVPRRRLPLPIRLYNRFLNNFNFKKKQAELADFNQRVQGAEVFTFPTSVYDITESPLYKEADIIQLHWVSGFLDEPSFFAKNTKPVIWRMADLYVCGAGNHYEIGFPFEALKPEMEANFKIRQMALHGKNITFVPISKWVEKKANNSLLIADFPKKLIHNGVDISVFKPHNKEFARKVFNIDRNKTVLLFGAQRISNLRKGFSLLTDALHSLDTNNIQLVTFGLSNNVNNIQLNGNVLNVGDIQDERLLSVLFSAADYFVMSSIEEAFGQTTIEAIASGTPVISFPNGGSLDIIENGKTGILSSDFTSKGLAQAIKTAFDTKFDKSYIVEYVNRNFNILNKVDEYIELYEKLYTENN